jgi:hypothetical protein
MPLTEEAKALTEAALESFGDDSETASMAYMREDVLEFDRQGVKWRRSCNGCDGTCHM